jgi:hypothetical protein
VCSHVIEGVCAEQTLLSVVVTHSDPIGRHMRVTSIRSFTVFVGTEHVSSMWK